MTPISWWNGNVDSEERPLAASSLVTVWEGVCRAIESRVTDAGMSPVTARREVSGCMRVATIVRC